jgi:hypothetical protein
VQSTAIAYYVVQTSRDAGRTWHTFAEFGDAQLAEHHVLAGIRAEDGRQLLARIEKYWRSQPVASGIAPTPHARICAP